MESAELRATIPDDPLGVEAGREVEEVPGDGREPSRNHKLEKATVNTGQLEGETMIKDQTEVEGFRNS